MGQIPQLDVATPWSFHFGASRVEDLAARAAERGIGALGMADRDGMWGALPFQRACEEHGLKPLLGFRLVLGNSAAQLLALDGEGWGALCRLSSRVGLRRRPGDTGSRSLPGDGAERLAHWIAAEGRGFAVLSRDPLLLRALAAARGPEDLYAASASASAASGLPPIAAPRVRFADRSDYLRHRLLVAIGNRTTLSRLEHSACAPPTAWLRSARALREEFRHAPEALHNAIELSERVAWRIPVDRKRLPRFPVPGGRSAPAQLARLCARGLRRRRVPPAVRSRYRAQLHRELALIEELGFADYFLIVAEIVAWARRRGIACCGRGSAANSLVSWLLGLTQVDPLAHGLYFERFLNRGRRDLPDVDLDFAWDERDVVLDHVYQRYGRDHVAMISTHSCFAARGAVRELARVMGLPSAEIGPVTRALPAWRAGPFDPETLRAHPRAARLPLDSEPWRTILREAARLAGFPRFLGVHAGGIVLTPSPLTDHLPLCRARKETAAGPLVLTQWDMYAVEGAGLVKIDLLGNRGLAVIRDAAAAAERNTGLRVDFSRVDARRDTRTRDLLARGETMGCFYIESPGMRALLRKLRCCRYSELVAASSIIRPGISASGMMSAYVDRHRWVREHHGAHDPAWYPHPALRALLGETYGVMTYQEDVMKIAEVVAGLDAATADAMRRAMGGKHAPQRLAAFAEAFRAGAEARGTSPALAAELWRQIESFSGYSFCKAHSASYAELSFRSAWLRAHFPAEFMAAVLRNHGGFYSSFAYLAEARRMGLRLLLPSIEHASEVFEGGSGVLRVGLSEIRGLSVETRRRILAARAATGPFRTQEAFLRRVRPAPAELEALIRAGALDDLEDGLTRPERMRVAASWARHRAHPARSGEGLFPEVARRPPPAAPEYPRRTRLRQEWEALGYLVSAHPLELYAEAARATGAIPARTLAAHLGESVRVLGWQVTQKPIRTRGGSPMLFLSFEDTTALYEAVLFPRSFRRLAPWTVTRGPYLVEGIPRDEQGAVTVEVRNLRLLDPDPVA